MNTSKTKTMVFSKKNDVTVKIEIDGEEIEQVNKMKYLGVTLTEDGRSTEEIKIRIAKAKAAFSEMKNILTSHQLSLELRFRLLNCYIYPIFLYGAETWTLTKKEEDKIKAFEMWTLRRLGKISWKAKMRNADVLSMLNTEQKLLGEVKKRQLEYFGHTKRHNSIRKEILEGKLEGKRPRGRQRTAWTDNIKSTTKLSMGECTRQCQDRVSWRAVVRQTLSQR